MKMPGYLFLKNSRKFLVKEGVIFVDSLIQMIVTVLCAVLASGGFWTYLQKRSEKKDNRTKLLVGIAHDIIVTKGVSYVKRGYISEDEFENLHDYLYVPYKDLGGNGSAERVMKEVDRLPIQENASGRN